MPKESGSPPGHRENNANKNNNSRSTASGNSSSSGNSRRNRRNQRQKKQGAEAKKKTWDGDKEELEGTGAVHTLSKEGNTYTWVTRRIAKYFASSETGVGDFRIGMTKQQLPPLTAPTKPVFQKDANGNYILDKEEHKEERLDYREAKEIYNKKKATRDDLDGKAFALVLDQCSQELRGRLTAESTWNTVNDSSDTMALLALIEKCMSAKKTRGYVVHVNLDAKWEIFSTKQTRQMSNQDFYDRLMDVIHCSENLGTGIGVDPDRIYQILADTNGVDPDDPTDDEEEAANIQYRDEMIAMLILSNADPVQFSSLHTHVTNQFTCGQDCYPWTGTEALALLENWTGPLTNKRDRNSGTRDRDGSDYSFYQQGEDGQSQTRDNTGRGEGCGGGRGRGRGGSGRGSGGQGRGSARTGPDGEAADQPNDTQYFMDGQDNNNQTSDNSSDYSAPTSSLYDRLADCHQMMDRLNLQRDLLLLDSCSTVDLISDPNMLHGIHQVDTPI